MFLLKIKCSEVKVPHFPLKEQKVELKQTCSLCLLRIWRRRVCFVAALMLVIEITPVLWASSCWSRCGETWPEHHVWASFRFLKSSTDLSDYWRNVFVIMDFRGSQRSEVNEDLITSRIGFAAARTSASWNQTENIKVNPGSANNSLESVQMHARSSRKYQTHKRHWGGAQIEPVVMMDGSSCSYSRGSFRN